MTTHADVRGVTVQGEEPKQLLLSDGSSLILASSDESGANWRRADAGDGADDVVSVGEALALAGEGFSAYVNVRTRAEAAWLRNVAEWYGSQAERLESELGR